MAANVSVNRMVFESAPNLGAKPDGFYLFANDQVLDFYPRFGFRMEKESGYSKAVRNNGERRAVPVSVAQEEKWVFLYQVIAQESVDTDRIVQAFGRKILFFVSCLENSCMSRSGS